MVDLLGERGNKNQGVQHKKCQQPDAAKDKRNQPEHNCHNQQSCRFGFVQQTEYFDFLGFFARKRAFPFKTESRFGAKARGLAIFLPKLSEALCLS
jgi:hypothetical protein